MLRILHTSDWQMGLKACHVAAAGTAIRAARLDAAREVVAIANRERADVLLLAGDTFEHNLVEDRLVHEVVKVLSGAQAPVFVLPGNHDALSHDSVFRRASWRNRPANVVILEDTKPVPIPGTEAVLLPAPVLQKKSFQDPTATLAQAPAGAIAIGVAHGSLRIEGKHAADDFPIALDAAHKKGLDYLALGHWHAQYVHDERTAYSGTHEPTKFGEGSGQVLIVEIANHGAVPRIQPAPTARLRWEALEADLSAGAEVALQSIRAAVKALPNPGQTLMRLRTLGESEPDAGLALHALEDELAVLLLHVSLERADVPTSVARGKLAEVAADNPLVAGLLADLETASQGEAGGAQASTADRAAARQILGELVRRVWP
ncbi:MAG: DNA repair exonuclease [Deltaproteobacteria bacterium]|nr:DNA repair exonuclease [Deltaproteobacteria bacterium]